MVVCLVDTAEPSISNYVELTDDQYRFLKWLSNKMYLHQDIEYYETDLPKVEKI